MFNFESEKINNTVDGNILQKFEDYKKEQINFDDFFGEMQKYKKVVFEGGSVRQKKLFDRLASEALQEEETRRSRTQSQQGGVA
ncbi:hypothetical protein KKB69_01230 [Patescibacteria group bacterium]|nr:hypothetical protein [Patescibacteria group bacterium]